MTTSTYGDILIVMGFIVLVAIGVVLMSGKSRYVFYTLIPLVTISLALVSVGKSPVLDTVRGERAIGDWLYYDSMDLSEDDANRIYSFLDRNEKADFMVQFCQPQVAFFFAESTMGSVRGIGRCWKELEITSVRKRFLDSPKS